MQLTFKKLYNYTERNIKRSLSMVEFLKEAKTMNIEFPGYRYLRHGDYEEGKFVTLFLDIRNSTERALKIGGQKTFVTMQALLPTLARIIDNLGGFVVDYPGMVLWHIGKSKSLLKRQLEMR